MVEFPQTIEQIDVTWLTDQLRQRSVIDSGSSVSQVLVHPLEIQGAASSTARLQLRYHGNQGPASVVAKVATPNPAIRGLAKEQGLFRSELMFYRSFAADLGDTVPSVFAAEGSDDGEDFVLVLEDLAPGRVGDRLQFSREDAELAVDGAVTMHTTFWTEPTLREHDWLPSPFDGSWDTVAQIGPTLDRASDACDARFSEIMAPSVTRAARAISAGLETIQRYRASRPFALIHGDYHPNQLFFPSPDGGRFAVFDWQTVCVGMPAEDLARLLVMGFASTERRAVEADLLDRYHNGLLENGVDYSRDDLLADYSLALFRNVVVMVIAHSMVSDEWIADVRARASSLGVGDPIARIFDSIASSIEDHDFLSRLSSIRN